MTVEEKVNELLEKEYRMDFWDCYNDEPNTDEWMLEQSKENSLIVLEEVIEVLSTLFGDEAVNEKRNFYEEVKKKLLKL